MKAYILAIAGIVLVAALITLIAPSGKMGKFLKGATKLAILAVMLLPVRALLSGEIAVSSGGEIALDEGYLTHCAEELAEGDAAAIVEKLEEDYGVSAAVRVERELDATFSYRKIQVRVIDFGITPADEHIYMIDAIEAALEAHYGCDAEVS